MRRSRPNISCCSHYLGEIDERVQAALADYLRKIQGTHGGWPLFHGGEFDLSASVKAYFALKAAGDAPDAPHMARAREAILAAGGAAQANVFTRIQLALFGELPWRAVPVMPVEIMLLPRWFPFHLNKVSYWSRTVLVPLLVLMAKKPLARNPRGITIRELFAPGTEARPPRAKGSIWATVFNVVDDVLRAVEPLFPQRTRQRAIDAAVAFVRERLNGDDGLGGIYPAMANAAMMFDCLGVAEGRSRRRHLPRRHAQAARPRARSLLLPAVPVAGVGYRPRRAGADRGGRIATMRCGAGSIGCASTQELEARGRLGGGAARRQAGRLGLPIRQPALSRSRRHGDGGDGARPLRWRALSRGDRSRRRMARRHAARKAAAGPRSMPTTNIAI